jgi:hypothetical protein
MRRTLQIEDGSLDSRVSIVQNAFSVITFGPFAPVETVVYNQVR